MLSLMRSVGNSRTSVSTTLFTLPTPFPWTPGFDIYERANGSFTTTYDPDTDKPSGTEIYISPAGDDSTGDGTSGNPYKTPQKAVTESADVIYFQDGYYDRSVTGGTGNYNFTSDIALIAVNPGKVFMGRSNSYSGGSYTQQAGPNDDVYAVTRSNARVVIDDTYRDTSFLLPDGIGILGEYTRQTSIADCQANPGSFYISGSTVYVHTWDSRAPDADIKITLSENNIAQSSDITLYTEGIVFYGEAPVRFTQTTTNTAKFVAVDCVFCFEYDLDGLDINDVADVRLIRCGAHNNSNDGFNYHIDNTHATTSQVLEIDCWAYNNGSNGSTNDNASTVHDGVNIIRLNGIYDGANGPVIADVDGSYSINCNCTARNSYSNTDNTADVGFYVDTGAAMWLYNCRTEDEMHYDRAEIGSSYMYSDDRFNGVSDNSFGTISSDPNTI